VLLQDINQSFESYAKSYQTETRWITLLEAQITDYENAQTFNRQQRAELRRKYGETASSASKNMDDEINELKNSLDPIAVSITFTLLYIPTSQLPKFNLIRSSNK
jgi:phage-related minor tail protein